LLRTTFTAESLFVFLIQAARSAVNRNHTLIVLIDKEKKHPSRAAAVAIRHPAPPLTIASGGPVTSGGYSTTLDQR
jgi:hypothetical protein